MGKAAGKFAAGKFAAGKFAAGKFAGKFAGKAAAGKAADPSASRKTLKNSFSFSAALLDLVRLATLLTFAIPAFRVSLGK